MGEYLSYRMIFEYGDSDNPTGNAIIYWRLEGKTEVLENAEIVASNFVISPLQYKNETLMVNFPPVLIETHEELLSLVRDNKIDLIRGEDIKVPDEVKDIYKFYKKQIKKYNGVLQQYLLAYKQKNSVNVSLMSLPQLIGRADSLMRGVRKMVRKGLEKERIIEEVGKLREIQHYFDHEMKGFDLDRIINVIDRPDGDIDQLIDLYSQKFIAIFLEDYEKAITLKGEIERLEENIVSS